MDTQLLLSYEILDFCGRLLVTFFIGTEFSEKSEIKMLILLPACFTRCEALL